MEWGSGLGWVGIPMQYRYRYGPYGGRFGTGTGCRSEDENFQLAVSVWTPVDGRGVPRDSSSPRLPAPGLRALLTELTVTVYRQNGSSWMLLGSDRYGSRFATSNGGERSFTAVRRRQPSTAVRGFARGRGH